MEGGERTRVLYLLSKAIRYQKFQCHKDVDHLRKKKREIKKQNSLPFEELQGKSTVRVKRSAKADI